MIEVNAIEKSIDELAKKAKEGDANEALKYTQAALNLSHVLATNHNMKE